MQTVHLTMAAISALGGMIALVLTWLSHDWMGPGTVLAVVLLLNAAVRLELARR